MIYERTVLDNEDKLVRLEAKLKEYVQYKHIFVQHHAEVPCQTP